MKNFNYLTSQPLFFRYFCLKKYNAGIYISLSGFLVSLFDKNFIDNQNMLGKYCCLKQYYLYQMKNHALVMDDNGTEVSRSHAMPKKILKLWP